jgi:hypothetical protein
MFTQSLGFLDNRYTVTIHCIIFFPEVSEAEHVIFPVCHPFIISVYFLLLYKICSVEKFIYSLFVVEHKTSEGERMSHKVI